MVELLVVIAILVILGVLLSPTFFKMLERQRVAVCTGNLKEMVGAFQHYINDHNGEFFPVRDWSGELYPYLNVPNGVQWKQGKEFDRWKRFITCPSVNALSGIQFNSGIYTINYVFLNSMTGSAPNDDRPPATWPIRMVNVASPSKAWAFTEAGRRAASGSLDIAPLGYISHGNFRIEPGSSSGSPLIWPHVHQTQNLAFLDGHVELMDWNAVMEALTNDFTNFNGHRKSQ